MTQGGSGNGPSMILTLPTKRQRGDVSSRQRQGNYTTSAIAKVLCHLGDYNYYLDPDHDVTNRDPLRHAHQIPSRRRKTKASRIPTIIRRIKPNIKTHPALKFHRQDHCLARRPSSPKANPDPPLQSQQHGLHDLSLRQHGAPHTLLQRRPRGLYCPGTRTISHRRQIRRYDVCCRGCAGHPAACELVRCVSDCVL
ncbi:hypothetical protein BU25DRAFT_252319 [Macroventuria anomochaeta]|uniref:Uncharacterized protein n=1 Tax=Macroventuria anomochaeta TaxID=301207 RepID=A0ACB6RH07_9PLEO|nr:uncharacterized protein BU25DRAFT_252319 [Macroventuria anomochaeta]KAF2621161.1 hypothetical protein BU25DRAFT_252319 [Macroventuria anomochaeta]